MFSSAQRSIQYIAVISLQCLSPLFLYLIHSLATVDIVFCHSPLYVPGHVPNAALEVADGWRADNKLSRYRKAFMDVNMPIIA